MIDLLEYFVPIFALGSFMVMFSFFKFDSSILQCVAVGISILSVLMPN